MLKVAREDAGKSLLQYLKTSLGETVSGREIKRAIEANLCQINGKIERHASIKLRAGDRVLFQYKKTTSKLSIEPSRILFEDDYILIYNKPAGINSDGNGLASYFPDYTLVHRLDKETTGVIIFAKNAEVAAEFKTLFKSRKIRKIYQVLVDGAPVEKTGIVESYIGRIQSRGKYVLWGSVPADEGREAKTLWRLVRRGEHASLMECEPLTGRTHQIRVHMLDKGLPILGDYRYQRRFKCTYLPDRVMLHAYTISFTHPKTQKSMIVTAPLPEDFQEAVNRVIK